MNNAKQRKTIEWERLKISSRKRGINGIFHARMGMIKDRNDKDLIEAEKIKKRCQDYTEELHKKVLRTRITTMVWSLTQNQTFWSVKSSGSQEALPTKKASGGDGISAELRQILKDDAVKVLHSICQQTGKFSSGHSIGKGYFSFQSQIRSVPKNVQSTVQLC